MQEPTSASTDPRMAEPAGRLSANALPRVPVFDMAIQATNRVLRIATHGRGIWEISLSTFTLWKLRESFDASGGIGTVNVTGAAGPTWTATESESWITITDPGPGTGNGTVTYTVAANPAAPNRAGTITIANQTFTVLQGAAFVDVPTNNPFYNDIGKLSARGVTVGCGGGNYCPNIYCPTDPVLREQMAAFLIRALGELDPPTPSMQRFDDVPASNSFYNFIDRMAVLGIISGCSQSPPLYFPGGTVTREQMAAFLVRAFNL